MAPTPYSASYQLDIHYTVDSLAHLVQLPCDSLSGFTPYNLERWTSGSLLASAAATEYTNLLKNLLLTTDSVDFYILQKYDSGIFIPVETGALGVAGTVSGSHVLASQLTMTLRDTTYKVIKHTLMEIPLNTPQRYVYPTTTPAPVTALIASLLDHNTVGSVGNWIRSRGDEAPSSIRGVVTTYNRRLRRARGLV